MGNLDFIKLFGGLFGGLAFFLYGMHLLSTSLEKMVGGKLEHVLRSMTSNRFKALLLGMGIDAKTDPNYYDDEDIRKKLAGSAKSLTEWLNNVHEEYILDKIFDIAKDMNLPASKIKVLSAKMPNRDFLE